MIRVYGCAIFFLASEEFFPFILDLYLVNPMKVRLDQMKHSSVSSCQLDQVQMCSEDRAFFFSEEYLISLCTAEVSSKRRRIEAYSVRGRSKGAVYTVLRSFLEYTVKLCLGHCGEYKIIHSFMGHSRDTNSCIAHSRRLNSRLIRVNGFSYFWGYIV